MVERPDHFSALRSAAAAPVEIAPEEAPLFTMDQVEYLDRLYTLYVPANTYPGSMDQVIQTSMGVTYYAGQRAVIEHIRTLSLTQRGA